MTSSLMPLLAFVVVIALIPAALWVMKRAGVGGVQAGGVLRPVASLALGSSQRVAVVEVAVGTERHWLVLGVTGEHVAQLASYAAPEAIAQPPMTPQAQVVNQLLARWRGQGSPKGESHGE